MIRIFCITLAAFSVLATTPPGAAQAAQTRPNNNTPPALQEAKRPPRLDIEIIMLTKEIAELLNLVPYSGVLVHEVHENGPAQLAGIQSGDVITRMNGQELTVPDDLVRIGRETPLNREIEVVFIRKGQEKK
jgi:serine protease Do